MKKKIEWNEIEYGIRMAMARCHRGLCDDDKYIDVCADLISRYSRTATKLVTQILQEIVAHLRKSGEFDKIVLISPNIFQITFCPSSSTGELCLNLYNPLSVCRIMVDQWCLIFRTLIFMILLFSCFLVHLNSCSVRLTALN